MDEEHFEERFEQRSWSGASLFGQRFERCTFVRCDLSGADLGKSKFIECVFEGCDLSMVKVSGTALQNVRFKECKMMGIDLSACSEMLFETGFEACTVDHSVFAKRHMPRTRFVQCSLKGTAFEMAQLEGSVFDRCDLLDAVFDRTDLRKADLSTAYNFRIDPDSNKVRGARFSMEGAITLLDKYGLRIE